MNDVQSSTEVISRLQATDTGADDWAARLSQSFVPGSLHDEVISYFTRHQRPAGKFLAAVLENNLTVALAEAGPVNRAFLVDLLEFLVRHAPPDSWGSVEAVDAWVKGRA